MLIATCCFSFRQFDSQRLHLFSKSPYIAQTKLNKTANCNFISCTDILSASSSTSSAVFVFYYLFFIYNLFTFAISLEFALERKAQPGNRQQSAINRQNTHTKIEVTKIERYTGKMFRFFIHSLQPFEMRLLIRRCDDAAALIALRINQHRKIIENKKKC